MKYFKTYYSKLLLAICVVSCVEPVDITTITYEDFLVVEATITNELKNQQVKLSRTFQVETDSPKTESNAVVTLEDDMQNTYTFTETSDGVYTSVNPFSAVPDRSYTLKIRTDNGRTYTSSPEKLTAITEIQDLTPILETTNQDVNGVSIYVNSFNPNNDANYYRYEYEETYQIAPPFWSNEKLVIISDTLPYQVDVQQRTVDNEVCYNTLYSRDILQTETASLAEDRVNYAVRFIADTDFIISKRYSILVKQYVQTFSAYTFLKTLETLSSSESLFTQTQPGFIAGNLVSETDPNDKVIGFFEISSVSEKRIFFNHGDVFSTPVPDFVESCDFAAPLLFDPMSGESPLIDLIKDRTHTYYKVNDLGLEFLEGPYLMVPKICGDCTELGTNIKPAFWVD